VGSVRNSYDNALVESIIGLYKTEVIEQLRPWNSMVAVEIETPAGWTGSATVDWWSRSGTFHQPSSKSCMVKRGESRSRWPDSGDPPSGEPRAVQSPIG
jgi:transposase InsO family protein